MAPKAIDKLTLERFVVSVILKERGIIRPAVLITDEATLEKDTAIFLQAFEEWKQTELEAMQKRNLLWKEYGLAPEE